MAHPSSSSGNHWLSNILRPRSQSVTVESCLNLAQRDASASLDARPVLPLLSSDQALSSRLKHLKVFSELCATYRFTHLENVFFDVQDILVGSMPKDARHAVFEFLLACIQGQYADLGMARVTFYNFLRSYQLMEDFGDMYRVLHALCNGGRDISGFEKSINKLLIQWLEWTLRRVSHYPHRLLLASHPPPTKQQRVPNRSNSTSTTNKPGTATAAATTSTIATTTTTTTTVHTASSSTTAGAAAKAAAAAVAAGGPPGSPFSSSTRQAPQHHHRHQQTQGQATSMTSSTSSTRTVASSIPFLSDILHLLTMIAKFNFALFEENQVSQMVMATRQAFYTSNHPQDISTCLSFCDVLVRYRFVPLQALEPFLQIICGTVTLPPHAASKISYWPIFLNLLRSHCAHNAILTLCNFLDDASLVPGSSAENLAEGAIVLLSRVAWRDAQTKQLADSHKVAVVVILLYFLRAMQKGAKINPVIHACILRALSSLVDQGSNPTVPIGIMEWDVIWDIGDAATALALRTMDDDDARRPVLRAQLAGQVVQQEGIDAGYDLHYQLGQFLFKLQAMQSKKQGTMSTRWMDLLYALRLDVSGAMALSLLDYYHAEHLFLPSSDRWLDQLWDMATTFYLPSSAPLAVRSRVLAIVTNVYTAIKDFYMDDYVTRIVLPMCAGVAAEKDKTLRQDAIDLLVQCARDCHRPALFDTLLHLLQACAVCHCNDAANPKTTKTANTSFGSISGTCSPSIHGQCTAIPGICGLLDLFEQLLHNDLGHPPTFCAKAYRIILDVVQEPIGLFCAFGGPRLIALDMLLRLRCSSNHRLFLIEKVPIMDDDDQYVAEIRQEYETHKKKVQQQQADAYPATISCPAPAKPRFGYAAASFLSYNPQAADDDNEEEDADADDDDDDDDDEEDDEEKENDNEEKASQKSHTSQSNQEPENDGPLAKKEVVLDMNGLLHAYLSILSECPNWHVVVFLLQRLSWQLATKHLFCGSRKGIRLLSRLLVKGVTSRHFLSQVTNVPPVVKRNDFTIHAYQLLTVLVSYRYLNKRDQDEIVYAFYVGITQVTPATKTCIHALALCCHELPLSIAKMLNEILRRMSQIISVGSVAVHILEFLSGLARLPNLYANFTGDMYKPVFAIALNYLQHARTTAAAAAAASSSASSPALSPLFTSMSSPNANATNMNPPTSSHLDSPGNKDTTNAQSQPMAQYVLTMAYLVITIWFTAIPLRERRKHVPFIVQRLLAGGHADEPTYTCVDMLSRFTFADLALSPNKSLVSKILMGDVPNTDLAASQSSLSSMSASTSAAMPAPSARTWVYGYTLFTLKTAKALGWVEVTIRRPSGTVSMMCNIENAIKTDDIDYKTLPALLMMQYQPDLMTQRLLMQHTNHDDDNEIDEQHQQDRDDATATPIVAPKPSSWMDQGEALGISLRGEDDDDDNDDENHEHVKEKDNENDNEASFSSTSPAMSPTKDTAADRPPSAAVAKSAATATSAPSSNASSPLILPPGLKTPRLGKTKETMAQEERIQAILRDILSDPAHDHPQQQLQQQQQQQQSQQQQSEIRKSAAPPPLDPAFLYMQMINYPDMAMEGLPPLPDDDATTRAIGNLDRIPVVDFHKIGLIYVRKGQTDEISILANDHGSPDYVKFLHGLGTLERLRGRQGNTGGLDRANDIDGAYAYFWRDDVTEMVFHVATMMPTRLDRDPRCSGKKRHIGNDFITIVYVDDVDTPFKFDTLPGQFNFINIIIRPYSKGSGSVKPMLTYPWIQENTFFHVTLQRRADMPVDIGPLGHGKLISAQSLPSFIRHVALHANIFAQIFHQYGAGGKREHVSHWRERLRHIRRIKDRWAQQQLQQQQQQQPPLQQPSSSNAAPTADTMAASSLGGAAAAGMEATGAAGGGVATGATGAASGAISSGPLIGSGSGTTGNNVLQPSAGVAGTSLMAQSSAIHTTSPASTSNTPTPNLIPPQARLDHVLNFTRYT
ncbi:hypothetical protein BC940DRAFT_363392 [Gongronella butleri]|nr:hypothetical protein BC940DRAFT_363392 [Gongronella butleri]